MKKFFAEFKKFITRGNVMDMAVGIIIGSAFTTIVTAITTNILQPLINGLLAIIFGKSSLSGVFTYIKVAHVIPGDPTSGIDLSNSIYINWGALINAVINFILIALVLFIILKIMNSLKEGREKLTAEIAKARPCKQDRIEMKKQGIKLYDRAAVKEFMLKKEEAIKLEAEEKAKKEKAEAEEAKKHTTEGLLEQIKELLEKSANK